MAEINYQTMDIPPEVPSSRSAYRRFLAGFAGVQAIGLVMMTLLGVFLYSFGKSGFAWDKEHVFKFHPLFMTTALVHLNSKGMLLYRLMRNRPKLPVKIAHACFNLMSFGMTIAGLVAVIQHKNDLLHAHFFSLHSWLGIGTIGLFGLQWLAGFLVFLYPGGSPPIRAIVLRLHRFCGAIILGLACMTVLTGAVTLAGGIANYDKLSWSASMLNAFSISVVLFCLGVLLLLAVEDFRRPPG
ncbi:hypothetical protein BOX15_Mlig031313g3 [Macrostomum lignano]|uniref:Cytochrome b561 domain-containing protein n=1 Tax=Macrostomum lignano TaxID=282301 RepID=A0A267G725_9PLAT|nr:hypothetical protein BOX15_Mlig031313g3 [Macrostomum lignano]